MPKRDGVKSEPTTSRLWDSSALAFIPAKREVAPFAVEFR